MIPAEADATSTATMSASATKAAAPPLPPRAIFDRSRQAPPFLFVPSFLRYSLVSLTISHYLSLSLSPPCLWAARWMAVWERKGERETARSNEGDDGDDVWPPKHRNTELLFRRSNFRSSHRHRTTSEQQPTTTHVQCIRCSLLPATLGLRHRWLS